MNLGSGEAVMFSARGVRLDDSRWHSVVVNRTSDTAILEIDGITQGQTTMPGTYYDLNVDIGVLLGSKGNLKKDFGSTLKPFRGCLKEVVFNDRDVLSEAKALRNPRNSYQVSWYCDDDIFARSDSPISFSSDSSFVAFPFLRIYPNQDAVFSCDFKTRSSDAIILFNSGSGSTWEDYLAIELVGGKITMAMDKGSGVIELYVNKNVNDGKWHQLEVTVSQSVAKLQVDSLKNTSRSHLGGKKMLNLANHLYVGGIGYGIRSNAIKLGLAALQGGSAMRGSIMGCVRNIKMNSRSYSFRQIEMSRLVDSSCAWNFPCADDPCVVGASCVELERRDFRCDCDQQVCTKDKFSSASIDRNKDINGIFTIRKLTISRGTVKKIDEKVIKPTDKILKAVRRERMVVFMIEEHPKYGRIEYEDKSAPFDTFTLEDLKAGKVFYRHSGTMGSDFDSVVLKVRFRSLNQDFVSKIKSEYEFIVSIDIEQLSSSSLKVVLNHGNVIALSSGARIAISPQIIDLQGTYASPSTMIFSVNFLRQSKSWFELANEKGRAITSFSLKDVQEGAVYFQHEEDKIVYTRVTVDDGVSESDPVDLRFKMEALRIDVVNNTGLLLSYGRSQLITSHNLSSSANVHLEQVDIEYHIIRQVTHGAIQKMDQVTSQWLNTDNFSQREIDLGHVRYSHQPGPKKSRYDQFKFEIRSKNVKSSPMLFNIRFRTVMLMHDYESDLILQGKSFGKFSNSTLLVTSNAMNLNLENIIFTVLRPPSWGKLYMTRKPVRTQNDLDGRYSVGINDTFTQQDVSDGLVYYKLNRQENSDIEDHIVLQPSYFGFYINVRVMIEYYPEPSQGELVNTGMSSVAEGGHRVINQNMLYIIDGKFEEYTFTLDALPLHGVINIVEPRMASILRKNTSFFTLSEIKAGKVVYWHDDSENEKDAFIFSVVPVIDEEVSKDEEIHEYGGKFIIEIAMQNDNTPIRVVNKIFMVVTGQTRHLTIKDLAFKDDDMHGDFSSISYHMSSISNGKLFRTNSMEQISNFTQGDLEAGSLIFKHSGVSYGRASFLVSDGHYSTHGFFDIQATDPFISVKMEEEIVAKSGQKVLITNSHLDIDSNLDFNDDDVLFRVIDLPEYGHLLLNGGQASKFTYNDVLNERLQYANTEMHSERDFFKVSVYLEKLSNQSTIHIKVISSKLLDPPKIVHNQILDIVSYHSEVIVSSLLKVIHPSYTANDIEYIVTKSPKRGHLTINGKAFRKGSTPEFTQRDIDEGNVRFTSDSSEILFDSFLFDVGTEHQSLRDVEFVVNIIPQKSQRNKFNVKVDEGESFQLTRDIVAMTMRLMSDKNTRIVVEKAPEHGNIYKTTGSSARLSPASSFTLNNVIQGNVIYTHDGSENYWDDFSLRALSPNARKDNKDGVISDITVKVNPVDDSAPVVAVNKGLDVWTGSITLLKNDSLRITDPDSNDDDLQILTFTPSNGYLAYLKNTFRQISKFSQQDINNEQVVFVHKGKSMYVLRA